MTDNGIILVDKPTGISSFGVVARIRGQLRREYDRKVKVGHTGTLDPFASGLMILVVGPECKNAGNYSKLDKTYEATIRLGQASTTGDPEGQITDVSSEAPTLDQVRDVLNTFVGTIEQTPPAFSAIKINGQRAYKLAREGKAVEMPSRIVTIHTLELLDYTYPNVVIRTHVSSGTYIRTLAEDIGKTLGTGAYCAQLRRTVIDRFSIDDAISIPDRSLV